MEHVICHLKPGTGAGPLAYNPDMSAYDSVDACPSDFNTDPEIKSCQWCCHTFLTPSVGIPTKKCGDTYSVTGQFCSHACAASYIFDQNADNNTAWTRYQMLNDMSGQTAPIVRAPPRNALKLFGGDMDIARFRGTTAAVVTRQPPTIVDNALLEEIPAHVIYRDVYKPLDEGRVNEYKLRMHRSKPTNSFYSPVVKSE
jgi:hypothetical protein